MKGADCFQLLAASVCCTWASERPEMNSSAPIDSAPAKASAVPTTIAALELPVPPATALTTPRGTGRPSREPKNQFNRIVPTAPCGTARQTSAHVALWGSANGLPPTCPSSALVVSPFLCAHVWPHVWTTSRSAQVRRSGSKRFPHSPSGTKEGQPTLDQPAQCRRYPRHADGVMRVSHSLRFGAREAAAR